MTIRTKEEVALLAMEVKNGNQLAFRELEGVAKPLLVSLANRFTRFHSKFDFDDFYSIGLYAMYKACMVFNEGNPSFLDYAKIFILRAMWREIEYWNQGKRNIFDNAEVEIENTYELPCNSDMTHTVFVKDFRKNVSIILDDSFDERKSAILRMHIFDDIKVCDIAHITQLNYKYVHKVIERGTKKLEKEYSTRFLDKSTRL